MRRGVAMIERRYHMLIRPDRREARTGSLPAARQDSYKHHVGRVFHSDVFAHAEVESPARSEAVVAAEREHDGFVEKIEIAVERGRVSIDLRFERQPAPCLPAQAGESAPDDAALLG